METGSGTRASWSTRSVGWPAGIGLLWHGWRQGLVAVMGLAARRAGRATRVGTCRGVSMVEVMIGVIILGLVLVPSLQVLLTGTRTVTATRDHLGAVFLAQHLFETARTYPFNRLDMHQFPPGSQEEKECLEWDLLNDGGDPAYDKIKRIQNINGVTYEILLGESRRSILSGASPDGLKLLRSNLDPEPQPSVALFQFAIVFRGQDGKEHEQRFATAIPQCE